VIDAAFIIAVCRTSHHVIGALTDCAVALFE
jgi:hypothetical protein